MTYQAYSEHNLLHSSDACDVAVFSKLMSPSFFLFVFCRKAPGIKRRRVSGHVISYEEPLRRSKREKRLVFATLNMSQMDKQILNPGPSYQDLDLSEVS